MMIFGIIEMNKKTISIESLAYKGPGVGRVEVPHDRSTPLYRPPIEKSEAPPHALGLLLHTK